MTDRATSLSAFRNEEMRKATLVELYIREKKSNYVEADPATIDGLSQGSSLDWPAVSGDRRIAAAELLLATLAEMTLQQMRAATRVSTVRLSPAGSAVGIRSAHDVDVANLRREITKLFVGLDYFGVIEPGLYPRHRLQIDAPVGVVSWHAHILFWGSDRLKLETRVARYNRSAESLSNGARAADIRSRSWATAEECLLYMLKTPGKSYTLHRSPESVIKETGEIFGGIDKIVAQKLRPGQHVMMRNILSSFSLEDLLVFGSNGDNLFGTLPRRIARDREVYARKKGWV